MDHDAFDRIARLLGSAASRRAALGALLGAGILEAGGAARKRRDRGGKRKGRGRVRTEAACFSGTNCIPGPGKNLSKCDFGGTDALKDKNLKGANLGGANLADADASGANLAGANLGTACLVDANLTGATIIGSTNLGGAIFCRTTMPNGSENNSGCGKGTACCPTCLASDECPGDQVCCGPRCRSLECCSDADCGGDACCGNACCPDGDVCDAADPSACCTPAVCPTNACGPIPDGCGSTLECGSCGGATPNCCGGLCRECCDSAHCGGNVCCANLCCPAGEVCDTRTNPGECCEPNECPVNACGVIADGCGETRDCGPCADRTKVCVNNACVPCASDSQCQPTGNLCFSGGCRCGLSPACTGGRVCGQGNVCCFPAGTNVGGGTGVALDCCSLLKANGVCT
jgi:hypothetical protein